MYMDEAGHSFSSKPHCNTIYNWEIRVEKGMGKWVRIIDICAYTQVATSLIETKKGGETSKS